MRRTLSITWLISLALLTMLAGGCGEKIAIPEAQGLFSVAGYVSNGVYSEPGVQQLMMADGVLFVLTDDELAKRDLNYGLIRETSGFQDARALCMDTEKTYIFVWEQGAGRVSWLSPDSLQVLGSTVLPDVQSVVAMATNTEGVDLEPGARTFLYLSDPDSLVVHRYLFDDFNGLSPYGILTRSDGDAARFTHEPAGLVTDSENMILVCDAALDRNWVIRFDGYPDLADTASNPQDQDPWRGFATIFNMATCEPPAAEDYVLGDAAACGQTDWVGEPSNEVGDFSSPRGVTIDGAGSIYVADTGNNRFQIFTAIGEHYLTFGSATGTPAPTSLGVTDVRYGGRPQDINYGAYLFSVHPDQEEVRGFLSNDEYLRINREPPPPPE